MLSVCGASHSVVRQRLSVVRLSEMDGGGCVFVVRLIELDGRVCVFVVRLSEMDG